MTARVGVFGGHTSFGDARRYWDFRSLGRGDVDFEDIIVALNDVGYAGPLSVEWEDTRMDRVHGATEARGVRAAARLRARGVAFDAAFDKDEPGWPRLRACASAWSAAAATRSSAGCTAWPALDGRRAGGRRALVGARQGARARPRLGLADARTYGRWQDLLARELSLPADERIDFVAIVTPNHVHFPVAQAFVEAGFDVVCDKPLVHTGEQAERAGRKLVRSTTASSA